MSKHSRERALERYNIELTKYDEQQILQKIKSNDCYSLGHTQEDITKKFAYVTYHNIPMKVLYKRTNKKGPSQIITIYPFDADEYNKLHLNIYESQIKSAIAFLQKNKYIVYKRKEKQTHLLT